MLSLSEIPGLETIHFMALWRPQSFKSQDTFFMAQILLWLKVYKVKLQRDKGEKNLQDKKVQREVAWESSIGLSLQLGDLAEKIINIYHVYSDKHW